jgi:hypothetical protein
VSSNQRQSAREQKTRSLLPSPPEDLVATMPMVIPALQGPQQPTSSSISICPNPFSDTYQSPYTLAVPHPSQMYTNMDFESTPQSAASSSGSSLAPSDSISVRASSQPRSLRSRSHTRSPLPQSQSPCPEWTQAHQLRFEERLVRLTASAGLPLSWVENPEWIEFCTESIPPAKSPSRKVLMRRLLPRTLAELQSQAKKRVSGMNATASCDGWTGENFHHYIAFMIVVGKEVCQ